jgi:hypothetical protein
MIIGSEFGTNKFDLLGIMFLGVLSVVELWIIITEHASILNDQHHWRGGLWCCSEVQEQANQINCGY